MYIYPILLINVNRSFCGQLIWAVFHLKHVLPHMVYLKYHNLSFLWKEQKNKSNI